MHVKTYKYKLKPTQAQINQFERILGTCRFVYNLAKDCKETAYKKGVTLTKYDLIKQLPALKCEDWIKEVPSQTLQAVVERMDRSFQNFFRGNAGCRPGYPKWAKKNNYKSFLFKQGVSVDGRYIQLPKIGKVKYYNSREITAVPRRDRIKAATITKEISGWYISISFETRITPLPATDKVVGIDVGLSHLAIISDGELIENPKHTQKYERELRIAQRSLARKQKGSNNRKKQKIRVARLHEKIRNCRKDYQHKISTRLVSENPGGEPQAIAVEKLVVSNMLQNRNLSKSIADASWHNLVTMLEYKALWFGREFEKVTASYTSRDCSSCGYRAEKMPLSVRQWQCPECDTKHCRDTNAAINILNKASFGQNRTAEAALSRNVRGCPVRVARISSAFSPECAKYGYNLICTT